MLDMDEINREIDNLEHGKTTYGTIERLALLYAVRDHAQSTTSPVEPLLYSYAENPPSEFIAAFSGAEMPYALEVLDEHMDGVRILYPKEYAQVIRKLNNKG